MSIVPFSSHLLAVTIVLSGIIVPTGAILADTLSSELPKRAPGLWRITTVSPEIGMQSHDVCIAEADSIIGSQAADCSRPSVAHTGDEVIVTIECGVGDRRSFESLLFTGDFKSWYRAQSKISSKNMRSGFSIDAKFLGTCLPLDGIQRRQDK